MHRMTKFFSNKALDQDKEIPIKWQWKRNSARWEKKNEEHTTKWWNFFFISFSIFFVVVCFCIDFCLFVCSVFVCCVLPWMVVLAREEQRIEMKERGKNGKWMVEFWMNTGVCEKVRRSVCLVVCSKDVRIFVFTISHFRYHKKKAQNTRDENALALFCVNGGLFFLELCACACCAHCTATTTKKHSYHMEQENEMKMKRFVYVCIIL